MTREEMLVLLKEMKQNTINGAVYNDPKRESKSIALDMAIKALEQQPCEDAISRKEALKTINKMDIPEDMSVFEIKSHIGVEIGTLPPVQPKPKTGHWISYWDEEARCYVYKCPECGNKQPFDTKCCWECGTRLVEPQESEDKE
jgi:hypothetical protein